MNGLGGEKYDPSDLMPWERRVGKRARALFAKPAPVAVTRERIERAVERGVATSIQSAAHRSVNEHVAEAIMDALSAPVWSAQQREAAESVYNRILERGSGDDDGSWNHSWGALCNALARVAPLFAPPAPVAVTRNMLRDSICWTTTGPHVYRPYSTAEYPDRMMGVQLEETAASLNRRLSAPVSAEDVERACKAHWERDGLQIKWETLNESQRAYQRKDMRAALKSIGIATEGT